MSINKKFPRKTDINNNRLSTKFKKIKKVEKKKSTKSAIKIIIYVITFFIIVWFLFIIVLYNKYLKDLNVEQLKDYQIAETSIFYDRNWKELYKLYKEKRTYVDYEKISKHIVNALVAWEDKRFWENPWVDVIWLVRAGFYFLTWRSESVWGTSTLTQQLIRNTIIVKKNKESITEWIDRKIKEIFLSYKLTKWIPKEKILELYLNKIEFWHNAFGIEEAAKTFFNKSAKDANVFEASVLASLPKGPSYYSPYNHADRLVWYLIYTDPDTTNDEASSLKEKNTTHLVTKEEVNSQKELVNSLKWKISKLKWKWVDWSNKYIICSVEKELVKWFDVDSEWCVVLEYSQIDDLLASITVKNWNKTLSYYPWRKDYILWRMLEDKYITFDQLKESVITWMWYQFNTVKEKIISPHFVFYVKEYLEKKYWAENISIWGLKVYTTLDLDLQNKAQEIVAKQANQNTSKFNAKNAALVSLDNKTWWILAMVWSKDYFSEDWKWNVNIITSKLQPGSVFKPFVYAIAMQKNEIWTRTPIYDLPMTFPWNYKPKNFDWGFEWKMNIATALNHSRNIPAVKMFYMTSWVKEIVDFMHKLWAESLKYNEGYWASLALWTWEMTPLDMAQAYMVFANMWEKIEVNPILKIVDSKWNVIEDNSNPKKERVMPTGQAFLINDILRDTETRKSSWNPYLTIWRPAAAKTWTSTKVVKWKKEQAPANLWTIWYTPQITTVVWAWNTDWEAPKMSASWLEAAAPIWRDFMKLYHQWKDVLNWKKPDDVKNVTISWISWYLPNPDNPENNFLVSSYFMNPPKKIDKSYRMIEYDALCNWKVTEDTPAAAIKKSLVLEFHSLKPENSAWEAPVQAWAKSEEAIAKYGVSGSVTSVKDEVCKRGSNDWNIVIKSNISSSKSYNVWINPIELAFISTSPINNLEILANWEVIQSLDISNRNAAGIAISMIIPEKYANSRVKLEIRAVNQEFFSGSEIKEITVWTVSDNTNTPNPAWEINTQTTSSKSDSKKSDLTINITNPKNSSIKINKEDYFNLRFNVSPKEKLSNVNVFINNNLYKNLWNSGDYVIPINQTEKLEKWVNNLKIQWVDPTWATKERILQVEVI